LNFAGLLQYFAAHHGRPSLKPKSFTRLFERALRCGLGLVLLVSRQLRLIIMMTAASRVKLTCHS
jgi:hypothetical protein